MNVDVITRTALEQDQTLKTLTNKSLSRNKNIAMNCSKKDIAHLSSECLSEESMTVCKHSLPVKVSLSIHWAQNMNWQKQVQIVNANTMQ